MIDTVIGMLAAFVFVGLCGVVLYGILGRALNPILSLTDHFSRMVVGDLNLRLPVDGAEEMQNMAVVFNEMMGELELQIRDVTEEKQAAERGRQYLVEQLEASQRFTALADSAPMGIVLADPDLNIVTCREQAGEDADFLDGSGGPAHVHEVTDIERTEGEQHHSGREVRERFLENAF